MARHTLVPTAHPIGARVCSQAFPAHAMLECAACSNGLRIFWHIIRMHAPVRTVPLIHNVDMVWPAQQTMQQHSTRTGEHVVCAGSPWPRQQPHTPAAEHMAAAASKASEKTPMQEPHAGMVAQTPASVQGPLGRGSGYLPAHAHRPYEHQFLSPAPHSVPQQQPRAAGYMAGSAVRPQVRPSHGAGHMLAGARPTAQMPGHHGSSAAQHGPWHQQGPTAPRSQQPHCSLIPRQQAHSRPQGAAQAPAAQHAQMQAGTGPFQPPSAAASIRNAASSAVGAVTVTPQASKQGEPVPPQGMGVTQGGVVSGQSAQPLHDTAPPGLPHQQPQANSASSAPAASGHGPSELLQKTAGKPNAPPFGQRPGSMERVLLTDASGGPPHAACKGELHQEMLLAWVKSDVNAHLARLKQTSEVSLHDNLTCSGLSLQKANVGPVKHVQAGRGWMQSALHMPWPANLLLSRQ